MRRIILILIALFQLTINGIYAQSYEHMWAQLNKYEKDDLPKQVISQAEKILNKAQKEKQFAHMMRAWKTIVERKTDIEPDSFKVCIEHIGKVNREQCVKSFSPVQASVYNAIMGSAYDVILGTGAYYADKETTEKYSHLSTQHFKQVLVDMKSLSNEKSKAYEPLLNMFNADSRLFENDMLSVMIDFIEVNAKASFLPSEMAEIYAEAADLYRQKGNMNAYTLMSLQKLIHIYTNQLRNKDSYYKELKSLLDESQDLEVGADVAMTILSEHLINDMDQELEFIRWAKRKYKDSYCFSYFDVKEKNMMNPTCYVNRLYPSRILASHPFKIRITGKNMDDLYLDIREYNGKSKNGEIKKNGKLLQSHVIPLLTKKSDIERKEKNLVTEFSCDKELTLDAGHYVAITRGHGLEDVSEFHITSLRAVSFPYSKDEIKVIVLDNETGLPVPNVYLLVDSTYNKQYKVYCDSNGEVILKKPYRQYTAYRSDIDYTDNITPSSIYINDNANNNTATRIRLFTDRSIYRPGQTVHLSGIVYRQKGDETNVLPNYTNNVIFKDANNQTIKSESVRTDDMGTFSHDFIIPKDKLPGNYTFRLGSSMTSIQVEEYKRPTFQVDMKAEDSRDAQLTFGDTLNVKAIATTYSGVPVQDAVVRYTIQSSGTSFSRLFSNTEWTTIDDGELKTDEKGVAIIPLFLDNTNKQTVIHEVVTYKILVDVTDVAGETHREEYRKSVSKKGFGLCINTDNVIDLAKKSTIDIKAKNCNGEDVLVNGHFSIYQSGTGEERTDTIKGEFSSDKPLQLPSLETGTYVLYAYAYDKNNNKISEQTSFFVLNRKASVDFFTSTKGGKVKTADDILYCDDPTFDYGKPAEIFFAPCEDDINVYYYITANGKIIEKGNRHLNNGLFRVSVDYKSSYGNGAAFHVIYVRNGHLCINKIDIKYLETNKKLTLSWKTFRDKLQPGQKEEWILNVKDKTGKPVNGAHLLASMYDSSLDAITPHFWSFYVNYPRVLPLYRVYGSQDNHISIPHLEGERDYEHNARRIYDQFVEFVHEQWYRYNLVGARAKSSKTFGFTFIVDEEIPAPTVPVIDAVLDVVDNGVDNTADKDEGLMNVVTTQSPKDKGPVIRSNFDETAFFMPNLMTDKNGNAQIRFTLPESLTEWKFMGLAHTKDVQYGHITAKTVAQKDFMIQPNLPRFVREGDNVNVSARVINRCDKRLNGKAYMRLIDPETEKIVFTSERLFELQPNNTSSVDFEFVPSMDYPLLICEIVGETNDFSDGERNYIPVLTSKKFITESIPFYLERQKDVSSTVTLDLNDIFNQNSATATQKKMIFEFTENPEWSVIESLKALRVPKYDNAPAFGASLYSNYMAQHLVGLVPGLKEAVEIGLNRNDNQSDINSKLADNQTLKDILLNESPWVLDALGEEQKRNELLDYFNAHLVNNRIETATDKLYKMQLQDGSWSWFEGMNGSYYITLSVAEQLAYLLNATSAGKETKAPEYYNKSVASLLPNVAYMVYKAMDFLDDHEYKEYVFRKKHKYSMMPSNSTFRYLYLCTILPHHKETKKFTTMRDAYLKAVEKDVRNLTIYGRANSALLLRHYGHNKSADKFMQSVMEYSVYKPGMGRYFSTDNAYYSWMDYRIPTQIAVMRSIKGQESSINAILNAMGDKQDASKILNDMQIWLLRQKQTQFWDNPITIVDVIDFMLKTRQDENGNTLPFAVTKHGPKVVLHGSNESVQIETPLDTTKFLAEQLGYVNTVIDSSAYKNPVNSMDVTLEQTDNSGSISWGALYTQYLEDLDKIQSNSSGELKVETKFYLVPQGSQDKTQEIVDSNTIIHVGDKVMIRVIVTADRDMDFVQVRAQHPACFEPTEQLSGYRWMNGRGGYVAHHDSHTDIFYDTFRKGSATYDLDFYVNRTGLYQSGVVTAQCAYAPEFVGHSAGRKVFVK